MTIYGANPNASLSRRVAAATLFVLLSLLVVPVSAQDSDLIVPRGSRANTSEARTRAMIERDQRNREYNLRHLGDPVKISEEEQRLARRQRELILQQVQKDYRVIQELNLKVATMRVGGGILDYKQIAQHAGEINARASRLRRYLALPRINEQDNKPTEDAADAQPDFNSLLGALDMRVLRFVTNPFFKNPVVIDVELTTQASRDLKDIIRLSRDIKRDASRLHKSPNE